MTKLINLLVWFLFAGVVQAQTLTGSIVNEQKEPVIHATIKLLRTTDSSLVKTAISNDKGVFDIAFDGQLPVLIHISAVGYGAQYVKADNNAILSITLKRSETQLSAVEVKARKPLVEVKPDKLVFNVEGSINATGSNALDLLRKSPGVMVDKDDNISLSGKNGARVYIDGKPSPLAAADLAGYLRGLNSNDIEAIEIITNPSSKYDAEGNAGILNIRLKKNKNYGWNSSISGGYGVGIHSNYNGAASLNYRNKKINFFNNYSVYRNQNEIVLNVNRVQRDTMYDQHTTNIQTMGGQNLKSGLDIFLNKNNTIGILLNGNTGSFAFDGDSRTPISAYAVKEVNSILQANTRLRNKGVNFSGNINYKYSDSTGRELNVDADYGMYRLKNNNITPNRYTSADGSQVLSTYTFSSIAPTDIDLMSIKADYEQDLGKGKLSFGAKSSRVQTDNTFDFYNHDANDIPVYDASRSNRFVYTEWVNAGYAQYRQQLKKISYQLGIRLEHTTSEGDLRSENAIANKNVTRHYLDLFPNAGITWQVDQKNSLGLSYSRRIDRPKYLQLNPFENKLDELSYQKGNPFLKPQYTQIVELRHAYKYKLVTTLTYSHVQDFIAQVTDTTEGKRTFLTQRNLVTQDILGLNISYPFTITRWWSVYANLNIYYTHYKGEFEPGKGVDYAVTVGNLYQQQTFQLSKGWTAELSGWYSTPGVWSGTFKTWPMASLDAGLQKKFWHDNASLKATVSDIFFTSKWRNESLLSGSNIHANGNWESRQFKLNFTYYIGNKQVKNARNRETGLEDMNKRVSSQ